MIEGKRVLAVIPARGGSKGVPGKNIRSLNGLPLLAYSIVETRKSKYIDRVVVSTDADEIVAVAQDYDAEVIKRPDELASDSAPIAEALKHAVSVMKDRGFSTDIIVLLQPTSPFRDAQDIDAALELLFEGGGDSAVSVCEAPNKVNPHWVRRVEGGLLLPYLEQGKDDPHLMRQQLPQVYWRNGQIYVVWENVLQETGSLYGERSLAYIMPRGHHINIDEEDDFLLAEALLEKGIVKREL